MEELLERDDELKRLIREEGLLTTSPDFTRRVMEMVRESEEKAIQMYKPLLSRKTWFLIAAFTMILILVCWHVLANDTPDESVYSGVVQPVWDYINGLDLSFHFNAGGLLIATIAIASIGLLLSLDILLFHKYRQASN